MLARAFIVPIIFNPLCKRLSIRCMISNGNIFKGFISYTSNRALGVVEEEEAEQDEDIVEETPEEGERATMRKRVDAKASWFYFPFEGCECLSFFKIE